MGLWSTFLLKMAMTMDAQTAGAGSAEAREGPVRQCRRNHQLTIGGVGLHGAASESAARLRYAQSCVGGEPERQPQ